MIINKFCKVKNWIGTSSKYWHYAVRFAGDTTLAKLSKAEFQKLKLGFIGGGNMATALATGLVKQGLVNFNQVYVSTPLKQEVERWKTYKAHAYLENGKVVEEADVIILAVKPQQLNDAMSQANKTVTSQNKTDNKLFVSILAGVTLDSLQKAIVFKKRRIIRVMPNTPMMVEAGASAFCLHSSANKRDSEIVHTMLSSVGISGMVHEGLLNPVTALSGCGPAYICLVIEGLADGGVKTGLPRDMAVEYACQTALGTAKMIMETGKHPGLLKDYVCSPGGSTIVGMHCLESGHVRGSLMQAVDEANKKSDALGKK